MKFENCVQELRFSFQIGASDGCAAVNSQWNRRGKLALACRKNRFERNARFSSGASSAASNKKQKQTKQPNKKRNKSKCGHRRWLRQRPCLSSTSSILIKNGRPPVRQATFDRMSAIFDSQPVASRHSARPVYLVYRLIWFFGDRVTIRVCNRSLCLECATHTYVAIARYGFRDGRSSSQGRLLSV